MGKAAENFVEGSRLVSSGSARAGLAIATIHEELRTGRPTVSHAAVAALNDGIRQLVVGRFLIDSQLPYGVKRDLQSELEQIRETIRASVSVFDDVRIEGILTAARDPGADRALHGIGAQLEILDDVLGALARSVMSLERYS